MIAYAVETVLADEVESDGCVPADEHPLAQLTHPLLVG